MTGVTDMDAMHTTTLPAGHVVTGELPLYDRVETLSPDRHGHLALRPAQDYGFAAASPTVHITIDEFEPAMMDYPIIFYGPRRRAAVVTGLTRDRNLFVSPEGRYAPGAYIPAYLRRHPFVLASAAQDADHRSVVCIDAGSARLVPLEQPDAEPLFVDGAPSAAARTAIDFARAYDEAERRTEAFTALLDEFDLLEPRQASFRPRPDAEAVTLLDYAAVSREKLEALAPAHLEVLREQGVVAAIYAHLFSARRWDVLPIWSA